MWSLDSPAFADGVVGIERSFVMWMLMRYGILPSTNGS